MGESARPRVPIREGIFAIPDDVNEPPRLLGTRCRDCREHFFPRRTICAKCLSASTEDAELSPSGELYSFTFCHLPLFGSTNAAHASGYGVGQVDLPEGPRIQAPLAGARGDYQVGQRVVLELDKLREDDFGNDVMIVRFRPEGRSS